MAEQLGRKNKQWQLVFQSRSGPPTQPWLGPDILEYLRGVKARGGSSDLVIAPIGFVSDHLEIIFDLDTEARELCAELGLNMVRAETVGTHPRFISMIRELILNAPTISRDSRWEILGQGPMYALRIVARCRGARQRAEGAAQSEPTYVVILSEGNPFACEWVGEVEGPL